MRMCFTPALMVASCLLQGMVVSIGSGRLGVLVYLLTLPYQVLWPRRLPREQPIPQRVRWLMATNEHIFIRPVITESIGRPLAVTYLKEQQFGPSLNISGLLDYCSQVRMTGFTFHSTMVFVGRSLEVTCRNSGESCKS